MSDPTQPRPDQSGQIRLTEVMFKRGRTAYYLNPRDIPALPGVFVVVSADKGEDLGRVMRTNVPRKAGRKGNLRAIIRLASAEDIALLPSVRSREDSFFSTCQSRIRARNLPMKLVDVESQFDGNRVTFFFTAETRVDFRALVRDLADTFKTRIELRQIGVRDHAKRTGGCGSCGLPLCCATFLQEFQPVTLRMARDQSLSLSPSKISGVCGRLKCCLAFEHELYAGPSRSPSAGQCVVRSGVEMMVVAVDEEGGRVLLSSPDGEECTITLDEWDGHQGNT